MGDALNLMARLSVDVGGNLVTVSVKGAGVKPGLGTKY
jgi:hypothetical protein